MLIGLIWLRIMHQCLPVVQSVTFCQGLLVSLHGRTLLRPVACRIISRAFDGALSIADVIFSFELLAVEETVCLSTRVCFYRYLSRATVGPAFARKAQELVEMPFIGIGTVCFNS